MTTRAHEGAVALTLCGILVPLGHELGYHRAMPSKTWRAGTTETPRAAGDHVLISAGHPVAAAEGAKVLDEGGNAMDAAVTVAFVQGVVDPAKCGIGGWGIALCRAPDGATLAIDFPATAGSLARADQWSDRLAHDAHAGFLPVLVDHANDVGYGAIGVPAAVAGFSEIHQRFGSGRVTWDRLIEPAVAFARDGVDVVDGVLGAGAPEWDWPGAVPLVPRLASDPAVARRYLRDGRPLEVGSVLRQPELASTLESLAADGPASFYQGRLADRIASDLATHGSTVTAEDLATYRPRVDRPIEVLIDDLTYDGPGPPAAGVSVAQMLILLERWLDRSNGLFEPGNVIPLAMALGFAARERHEHLGDPHFGRVDVDAMLDRARQRAEGGWQPGASDVDNTATRSVPPEPAQTTSVVVLDADGSAIAMNHSLAGSGGAGVATNDLGFLYNNSMAGFDVLPGGPNSIAPGKARWTAACPTIVSGPDGTAILAATGPGGSRAAAAVVQAIVQTTMFGEPVERAVALPRIDVRDGVVDVEPQIPDAAREALLDDGWAVNELPGRDVAATYMAQRLEDGRLVASADPRRPGSVAGS